MGQSGANPSAVVERLEEELAEAGLEGESDHQGDGEDPALRRHLRHRAVWGQRRIEVLIQS